MKSRGMKHSNQVREFIITDRGLDLQEVYLGPDGVLTGSAREAQKLHELTGAALHNQAEGRKDREIDRKRQLLESNIANLRMEFESIKDELNKSYQDEDLKKEVAEKTRQQMTDLRRGQKNDK